MAEVELVLEDAGPMWASASVYRRDDEYYVVSTITMGTLSGPVEETLAYLADNATGAGAERPDRDESYADRGDGSRARVLERMRTEEPTRHV